MRVMGLDPATSLGWALYDTDRAPSAIVAASVRFDGENGFAKVSDIRRKLPKLIREHHPDFIAIEAPLEIAPQFKKKTKTMFGDEVEETTTINSRTIAQLNKISGADCMVVMGQNIPCVEVRAQTWQTIIPKTYQGTTKARAKAYCDSLKISAGNIDARDAAVIALWAAGHCQQLKMLERARA